MSSCPWMNSRTLVFVGISGGLIAVIEPFPVPDQSQLRAVSMSETAPSLLGVARLDSRESQRPASGATSRLLVPIGRVGLHRVGIGKRDEPESDRDAGAIHDTASHPLPQHAINSCCARSTIRWRQKANPRVIHT